MKDRNLIISEVNRHLKKTEESAKLIENATVGIVIRDCWEDFVNNFGLTIGKLISAGMKNDNYRPLAYKLKNASNKDDPGLCFLREARNVLHHGLMPFADFEEAYSAVGGIAKIGGNSTVHFSDNIVNGVNTGTFSLTTENGKIVKIDGNPNIDLFYAPAQVVLQPLHNEEKRKTVPVPSTVFGEQLVEPLPIDLVRKATHGLKIQCQDFSRALLKKS